MTKTQIMNNVTRTIHKGGFWLKKHSPEILTAVGSVAVVASAVMVGKATTKILFSKRQRRISNASMPVLKEAR